MTQVQPNTGIFAPAGAGIEVPAGGGAAGNFSAYFEARQAPDRVAVPSWRHGASAQPEPAGSGIFGSLLDDLNSAVQALSSWLAQLLSEQRAEGNPAQNVRSATLSSIGDPHLAESGQLIDGNGAAQSIERHFDSMSAHDNLVSSQDFDGGYRVSTTVTRPDQSGVTMNQSATVHANAGCDTVTMNNDGTIVVANGGGNVELQSGQSITLAGGEFVTRDTDGSLTVAEANASGGSISTTMRASGGGVDVRTSVRSASVGGDIASA
ncbi:MAG: hypothetical protein NVS3B28_19690 [Candidatus Velthaea sp.]